LKNYMRLGEYSFVPTASLSTEPLALLSAFAEPTRLRLLALLTRGETCVCDLVDTLALPQPTVSRHLAHLRAAGLVNVRKDGLWCWYSLATASGAVHSKLLQVLDACARESRQLEQDAVRAGKVCGKQRCC
jgi:ArsR family transcriptional regulator